jgi:simple sugar transport system permease protein
LAKSSYQHESILLLLLLILSATIGWFNPAFFGSGNLLSILKSCAIPGILALGTLLVLLSGNIDISFPAIAAASMYVTCKLALSAPWLDQMILLVLLSATIGCLLGLANGVLVHCFNLPALIVTLGTGSLIRGGLLAFIGTRIVANLPSSMIAFSKATMFPIHDAGGQPTGLAISVVIYFVLALVTHLLLMRTMLGRGIYALGGAPESARRVGFPILGIQFFIYSFVGFLAGIAGILHASTVRNANPFDLAGLELTVIAAVVLGGTSITGGRGSVLGVMLGVALLVVLGNSLILLGLPSHWHQVASGLALILGTGLIAWRSRKGQSEGGA